MSNTVVVWHLINIICVAVYVLIWAIFTQPWPELFLGSVPPLS